MSCYRGDSANQLEQALSSILKQTCVPDELVLVEDGVLTMELYEIIERFALKLHIRRIVLDENKGLGYALNQGLKKCKYNLVMRMDTDDICHEERFLKQVKFMKENPDIDILGSWVLDINEQNEVINQRTFPVKNSDILDLIWTCPIAHPSVAFRRDSILNIGSYNTSISRRQDYELWFRAAINNLKFHNLPEFLLFYRFSDSYYKKNNLKVSWSQAKIGYNGLVNLKVKKIKPYIGVFIPVFRSVLPVIMQKQLIKLLRFLDPRKKYR